MVTLLFVLMVAGLSACSSGATGLDEDAGASDGGVRILPTGEVVTAAADAAAASSTPAPPPTVGPTATPRPTPTPLPTVVPAVDLVGYVRTSSGRGLDSATVSLGDRQVTTNADGMFLFPAAVAGEIRVERPAWISTSSSWDGAAVPLELELEPLVVRALRVSAYSEVTTERFDQLLDLAAGSSVNALVFDTKDESGLVRYETAVEEVDRLGALRVAYDPQDLIARTHEAGLYAITRIVSFEDPVRTAADPSTRASRDWVEPTNRDNWPYLYDLAVEACELGFDEIQLDYVRFPTGEAGYVRPVQEERVATIVEYVSGIRDLLHPLGCALSADIFGIVLNSVDDQGIGQMPEDLSHVVDAISPMVYPSHYSSGWLGLAQPNAFPYEVVADALDDGIPRLEGTAVMRPWLQAFWYTPDQIRRGIDAADDRNVGWILWEAGGSFTAASLPPPEVPTGAADTDDPDTDDPDTDDPDTDDPDTDTDSGGA